MIESDNLLLQCTDKIFLMNTPPRDNWCPVISLPPTLTVLVSAHCRCSLLTVSLNVTSSPRSTPWWLGSTLNSGKDEVSGICKPRSYHKSILATHPPRQLRRLDCGANDIADVDSSSILELLEQPLTARYISAVLCRPCLITMTYRQNILSTSILASQTRSFRAQVDFAWTYILGSCRLLPRGNCWEPVSGSTISVRFDTTSAL
ncbi:hypothetical protein J6590_092900 [Homalodisca vitripennis]|nr:hypothetical protein J6590_092900 [Homalodisca vitripennis]